MDGVCWDRFLGYLWPAQWDSWSPLGVVWINRLVGWGLDLKLLGEANWTGLCLQPLEHSRHPVDLWSVLVPPLNLGLSREQTRSPGAQQYHRPGTAAHSQLPPRLGADPEGRGAALSPGQCHHLQRLRGLGSPRPGQGKVP